MDRHLTLVTDETPRKKEQSCFDCVNGMFGTSGTFCRVFSEDIFNEWEAADDCPEFEES